MNGQYNAAGYLLVKPGPFLTAGTRTASSCLAEMVPDSWAIEWVRTADGERERHAQALGISDANLPAVIEWATAHFDSEFLWPNVFADLEAAEAFRDRFQLAEVQILGLALPSDLVDAFLALAAPRPQKPGYAPEGAVGVYQVLRERRQLVDRGTSRGFEVLGYDMGGTFHSFRCNYLETDFERLLGARFNPHGLLDAEDTARRCAQYANTQSTCARAWHPWLIHEYGA